MQSLWNGDAISPGGQDNSEWEHLWKQAAPTWRIIHAPYMWLPFFPHCSSFLCVFHCSRLPLRHPCNSRTVQAKWPPGRRANRYCPLPIGGSLRTSLWHQLLGGGWPRKSRCCRCPCRAAGPPKRSQRDWSKESSFLFRGSWGPRSLQGVGCWSWPTSASENQVLNCRNLASYLLNHYHH